VLNESISLIYVYSHIPNTVNGNIYVLVDFLIVIWLFSNLALTYSRKFLASVIILGIIIWIVDNIFIHSISTNNSLFRMISSLFIVIISMDKLNQLLFFQNPYPNRNTDILLSIGILSYSSYKAFVEAFNVFPMPIDRLTFYFGLWVTLGIINIVMNLLFTAAILCIPPKQVFTIRLS